MLNPITFSAPQAANNEKPIKTTGPGLDWPADGLAESRPEIPCGRPRFEETTVIAPATAEEVSAAVAANNAFTLDLHRNLAGSEPGNFFASPFNVNGCLSMVLAGARNQTATDMASTLHLDQLPGDRAHAAVGQVTDDLKVRGQGKGVQVTISNRVFSQEGFPVKDRFQAITRDQYGAEAETVDFENQAEKARTHINDRVYADTQERISDLLPPGSLNSQTVMVLTSAIHFKGDWDKAFDVSNTAPGDFTVAPGKVAPAQLMNQTSDFKFAKVNFDGSTPDRWSDECDARILEMPYDGGKFSMIAVLPGAVDGIGNLEANLTPENLAAWQAQMEEQKVDVTFPRFSMGSEFKLKQPLTQMGMGSAFEGADLTGIADADLKISEVFHKAVVDVDEKGTRFAAATGAVVALEACISNQAFTADHPFVFFVKDNETGALLCTGRVSKPE